MPEESGSKSWITAEPQKSDYFPSDARLLCPQDPVIRRDVKFKVHHAVRQCGRHPVGNGLVLFAVARRYDYPAVGQTVFPDSPVQYKLVTGGLNHGGAAFSSSRKMMPCSESSGPGRKGGHHSARPFSRRGSPRDRRDRAEPHGYHAGPCRDPQRLGHNLAFAQARCAPEKYRLVSGKRSVWSAEKI